METIDAIDFKVRCLTILDRVAATGEPVVVLKEGQPVAELRPVPQFKAKFSQHELKGTVVELGDIVEPTQSAKH